MERKHIKADIPIKEEIIIPKYRFDEINDRYKAMRNNNLLLEEALKEKSNQINELEVQIEEIKSGYEKALNILRVKEIFVDGGVMKDNYEAIIPKMTCKESERLDLAYAIVGLINKQKTNKN